MIPVEQRKLWRSDDHPDGPQFGDCMRACYASILGLPLEAVPDMEGYNSNFTAWISQVLPGVQLVNRDVSGSRGSHEEPDSWKAWPTHHYEPGYWIAGVYSYRIPDVEEFGCGCVERVPGGDPECEWCHGEPGKRSMGIRWGLHAVVMQNGRCVWDPHPERDKGFGPFRSAITFGIADPQVYAETVGLRLRDAA